MVVDDPDTRVFRDEAEGIIMPGRPRPRPRPEPVLPPAKPKPRPNPKGEYSTGYQPADKPYG